MWIKTEINSLKFRSKNARVKVERSIENPSQEKKRLILIEGSASLSAGQTHDSFLVFSVQNGV